MQEGILGKRKRRGDGVDQYAERKRERKDDVWFGYVIIGDYVG